MPHTGHSGRSSGPGIEGASDGMTETSRTLIHHGKKFDFEMVTVTLPGGRQLTREVVRHPGAVVIVPILENGDVVLIWNKRISIGQKLLECPAGTLEKGEEPALCAGRELIEETGYEAATILPLGWFHTTPGLTDEKMYAFVATGLKEVGQDLEEDENIEVEVVKAGEALGRIDRGEFSDAKSMLALLLAHRKGHLRA
ncbi:MAG: NUDIX hydrolase [Pyrinomonadaceae bacterium]|nr:NUDIX hydrolase [Phycisphaerales bacterium]